jgi:hypothetical protein
MGDLSQSSSASFKIFNLVCDEQSESLLVSHSLGVDVFSLSLHRNSNTLQVGSPLSDDAGDDGPSHSGFVAYI